MDRAEFMLSRPVCLSLPVEEVDKLLREKDGRCALVYLALLRAGGKPFPAESYPIKMSQKDIAMKMERSIMEAIIKTIAFSLFRYIEPALLP